MIDRPALIHAFSVTETTEELLSAMLRLESRLAQLGTPRTTVEKRLVARYENELQRKLRMLAALRDGQSWAWAQYPDP